MNNCKDREILPYRLYDINTAELLNGYYLKCTISDIGVFVVFNNEDEETSLLFPDHGTYYVTTDGSKTIPDPDRSQTDPTTYFKVPKKIERVLVRSQKPTADNNYTWYNLYADGWCEQGGICPSLGYTVIFPVVMSDVNYTALGTARDTSGNYAIRIENMTTTGMKLNSSSTHDHKIWWQVSGYANSAEYTKDKWDYQNIKVERPMIQLFNGSTDTALATCTSVLADVSSLKSYDYAVETQEASDSNNYTWYRLYKSGWVEQGGYFVATSGTNEISLPVQMKGIYKTYSAKVNACVDSSDARNAQILSSSSSTILKIITNSQFDIYWEVKGMSNR